MITITKESTSSDYASAIALPVGGVFSFDDATLKFEDIYRTIWSYLDTEKDVFDLEQPPPGSKMYFMYGRNSIVITKKTITSTPDYDEFEASSNLTAMSGATAITLDWDAHPDSPGVDIKIFRSTNGQTFSLLDTVTDLVTYEDGAVVESTIYFYKLLATKAPRNSLYSNTVTGRLAVAAPATITLNGGDDISDEVLSGTTHPIAVHDDSDRDIGSVVAPDEIEVGNTTLKLNASDGDTIRDDIPPEGAAPEVITVKDQDDNLLGAVVSPGVVEVTISHNTSNTIDTPYDAAAQTFFDAVEAEDGASITDALKEEISSLFAFARAKNQLSKGLFWYPAIGGVAASAGINAFDPSGDRVIWNDSPTIDAVMGVTFNGTTQYGDTQLDMSSYGAAALYSHSGVLVITQSTTDPAYYMGSNHTSGLPTFRLYNYQTFDQYYDMDKVGGSTGNRVENGKVFSGVSTERGVAGFYGNFLATETLGSGMDDVADLVSYSVYLGATNSVGSPLSYSDGKMANWFRFGMHEPSFMREWSYRLEQMHKRLTA